MTSWLEDTCSIAAVGPLWLAMEFGVIDLHESLLWQKQLTEHYYLLTRKDTVHGIAAIDVRR